MALTIRCLSDNSDIRLIPLGLWKPTCTNICWSFIEFKTIRLFEITFFWFQHQVVISNVNKNVTVICAFLSIQMTSRIWWRIQRKIVMIWLLSLIRKEGFRKEIWWYTLEWISYHYNRWSLFDRRRTNWYWVSSLRSWQWILLWNDLFDKVQQNPCFKTTLFIISIQFEFCYSLLTITLSTAVTECADWWNQLSDNIELHILLC